MRFLLKITVPHEPFSSYVKDGSVDKRMQAILGETRPEAAYFAEINGKRTALLIINMEQVSQMPAFGEPWFVIFGADVEFHPVMLGEDLGKANLAEVGKKLK
ncbi:MAG: panthothenate synthetase [Bacteroidota bacterium]|nr:panthothenate synthetase [Bacteroidota bacterium]